MKKIISAILAGACAVSAMSMSAFAAGTAVTQKAAASSTDIKLTASLVPVVASINVTVPSAISAVINPYGIGVTVGTGTAAKTYDANGVTSDLYTIINKTSTSHVTVKVEASVTVPTIADTVAGGKATKPSISIKSTDSVTGAATEKNMYIALVASGSKSVDTPIKSGTVKTPSPDGGVTPDVNYTDAESDVNSSGTPIVANLDNLIELGDEYKTGSGAETGVKKTIVLPDATATKDSNGGAVAGSAAAADTLMVLAPAAAATNADAFSYGQFKLTGSVNTAAKWDSKDKVTVNVVLNIGPSDNTGFQSAVTPAQGT